MQLRSEIQSSARWSGVIAEATAERDTLRRARAIVDTLVASPEIVMSLPLARRDDGYERNFLFGDGTMSVWAMCWAPGAATPIHDHHCACCFGMVAGELAESWFSAIDGDRVVKTHEFTRGDGFKICLLPSGPNIHQMANTTDRHAVSIHVYGFDQERKASSIDRTYELAAS